MQDTLSKNKDKQESINDTFLNKYQSLTDSQKKLAIEYIDKLLAEEK